MQVTQITTQNNEVIKAHFQKRESDLNYLVKLCKKIIINLVDIKYTTSKKDAYSLALENDSLKEKMSSLMKKKDIEIFLKEMQHVIYND